MDDVRTGRWEEASDGDGIVCSECREDFCTLIYETGKFNYCPNCGSKMTPTAEIENKRLREEIERLLELLKRYASCDVCVHNKGGSVSKCEYGGCSGGGNGKIKEDLWELKPWK